ncbi:MAG: hypothetical protein IPJ98_09250 [Bryobacterales bacterium]|nr:hypothetical protein [Bryobacterales bacterium]
MSDLFVALNDAVVRRLAGERSYQRGEDYYQDGCVETLEKVADGIRAVVCGTRNYEVKLTSDEGVLDYSCECPHASEGAFCKHCVATALAWLRGGAELAGPKDRRQMPAVTLLDAEKALLAEDHGAFVRMVIDWAIQDERLQERLLQFAARRSGPEAGVDSARQSFKKAVRVHGFVPYREANGWARGVDDAVDNFALLLAEGQAAAVIELCETALQQLDAAGGAIDDSDGHLTTLRERLQEIHYRACQKARPEPVALARRLFQFEMQSELEVFLGAAEGYSRILGARGLKEYRRLAEAEWKKVPQRTAGHEQADWGRHFRITHIMEALARAAGDVEELVAVIRRDLSHAYSYLRIAEVYREARQHDQALLWAEKGLEAFPKRTDGRLREFAAEEYHRRRRHDEAVKLMWARFSEQTCLETYRILERHAAKAKAWPEWRDRALTEIRQRIAAGRKALKGQAQSRWMQPNEDHSLLVEIFLYEGNADAAWREAREGGCSDGLWLQLAESRMKSHPEDAAPIFLEQAERALAAVRNSRYDEPVGLLVKAAEAMKRMNQSDDFVRHLESLRQKYKIKRNFIKLLDQKRKSLYLR